MELTLLNIEWNDINGFVFEVLYIETKIINGSSLLGISFAKTFLYVDLFWNNIKIYDKF